MDCGQKWTLVENGRGQKWTLVDGGCRTFHAFSVSAAKLLVSLYNTPKKICAISVICG